MLSHEPQSTQKLPRLEVKNYECASATRDTTLREKALLVSSRPVEGQFWGICQCVKEISRFLCHSLFILQYTVATTIYRFNRENNNG